MKFICYVKEHLLTQGPKERMSQDAVPGPRERLFQDDTAEELFNDTVI